ncbi:MAG: hypothetical protein Q9168_004583 [Polycauliona sp. 1 TL-2023]
MLSSQSHFTKNFGYSFHKDSNCNYLYEDILIDDYHHLQDLNALVKKRYDAAGQSNNSHFSAELANVRSKIQGLFDEVEGVMKEEVFMPPESDDESYEEVTSYHGRASSEVDDNEDGGNNDMEGGSGSEDSMSAQDTSEELSSECPSSDEDSSSDEDLSNEDLSKEDYKLFWRQRRQEQAERHQGQRG